MKKIIKKTLVASALFSVLGAAPMANASPVQFSGNGHWYEFVQGGDFGGWENAKNLAASSTFSGMSGHLATISDFAENQFIMNLSPNVNGAFGWLGASDTASEGTWQWVTGEAFSFTNWYPGEPNGWTNENYLMSWFGGSWNDIVGQGWVSGYFVEYEPGSVAQTPIPAAVWLFGTGIAGLLSARKKKQIA